MSISRKEIDHVSTAPHFQASSPLEKCSFACHLFLFPIGLVYLLWLLVPVELLETPEAISYYPNKDYALHIPVTALFLFLSAPFLYAAFNSLTVPDLNSLDAVVDVYTKSSSRTKSLSVKLPSPESTLPELCDVDPSALVWYARNENST